MHAFETPSLRVFMFVVKPNDDDHAKRLFVGFCRAEDWPRPAVTAVVAADRQYVKCFGGPYLSWIQTAEQYRRQGLAREMVLGIEKHLGQPLFLGGATHSGIAFCEAMSRRAAGQKRLGETEQDERTDDARKGAAVQPAPIRRGPRCLPESRRSKGRCRRT